MNGTPSEWLNEDGTLRAHTYRMDNPMLGMGDCLCGHVQDDPVHVVRRRLPVEVNFSRESPHRSGWVEYETRGDTVVIRQSLERSEQWESDAVYSVFIPRSILRYIAADPAVAVEAG